MIRARAAVLGGAAVVVLLVVVARYFVWVDVGGRCVIGIRPSLVGYDNRTVKRALETLRHGSPEDYHKVCDHVATINPNPSCGGFGGGCFWHSEGNRGRASIDVSTEHGLIWTVAILVHETCHAVQYHEGRPAGFDLERECYAEDDRILRALVQYE
ncbi:MAG TPA: hypothetical protein VGD07_01440 [Methylomirabilota bacterium]|jgi:hypothetical protein